MTKEKELKKRSLKKIEQHIKNYNQYKIGIRNMQLQLDNIMPNITVKYELREGNAGAFLIKSDTERVAIDRIESKRAIDLYEQLEKYRLIIDCIDISIDGLEENEKEFVKQRYFLKNSSIKVAEILGYGESTIFLIRTKILEKLEHSLGWLPEV